ncbi:MAG: hypothetical protein ABEJ56_05560 [Candidatus Nanohaloarchaea archaeon]
MVTIDLPEHFREKYRDKHSDEFNSFSEFVRHSIRLFFRENHSSQTENGGENTE